jgi:hypothetical protein
VRRRPRPINGWPYIRKDSSREDLLTLYLAIDRVRFMGCAVNAQLCVGVYGQARVCAQAEPDPGDRVNVDVA